MNTKKGEIQKVREIIKILLEKWSPDKKVSINIEDGRLVALNKNLGTGPKEEHTLNEDGKINIHTHLPKTPPDGPDIIKLLSTEKLEEMCIVTPSRIYRMVKKKQPSKEFIDRIKQKVMKEPSKYLKENRFETEDDLNNYLESIRNGKAGNFIDLWYTDELTKKKRSTNEFNEDRTKTDLEKLHGKVPLLDLQKTSPKTASEVYYHGTSTESYKSIMKSGFIIPPGIRNHLFGNLIEDILRIERGKNPQGEGTIDLYKYVKNNEEYLKKNAKEQSIEEMEDLKKLKGHLSSIHTKVNLGRHEQDGNHAYRQYTTWVDRRPDAVRSYGDLILEIKLPKNSVISKGMMAVVPGKIPVDYIYKVYAPRNKISRLRKRYGNKFNIKYHEYDEGQSIESQIEDLTVGEYSKFKKDQEIGLRIVGEGKRLEHKKELQPGFEKRNLDGIWFNISPEVNEVLYHVYGENGAEPLFRILKETEVWRNFVELARKRGLEEINIEPAYKSPGASSTGGGQGSHVLTKHAKEISRGERRKADLFYNTTDQEIIESDEKNLAGKAGEPAEIIIHEISHLVTKVKEFEKDRTAARTASRFGDTYRCYYCGEEFAFYDDFMEHAENEHEGIEAESILKNDSRRRNMMNSAEKNIADMGYLIKNLRYSYTSFWENAYKEGISVLQEKGIENLNMSKASRLMNKDLRKGFEKDVESLNTALSNTEEVIDMLLEEVDDGMTPDRLSEYNQILKKFIDILIGQKEKQGTFQSRAIYTIGFVAMAAYIAITNANLRDVMDMGARTFWKDFRIKWKRMENSSEMDLGRFLSKEQSHDVFYRVDEIYKVYLTGVETIRKAEKVRKKYQRKRPCPRCNRLCDENWKVCVYCGEKIIR